MKIMTKRLLLRPFTESDAKDWYFITQDNAIYRYIPYVSPMSIHQALMDIQKYYSQCDYKNDYYFLIDERSLKKPIGAIIITKNPTSEVFDISFFISKDFRKHGYMEEALKGLLKKWPEGKTIIFEVSNDNYASSRLLKKISTVKMILANQDHQVYSFTK